MTDPRNHPCQAPGCTVWGSYGFAIGKGKALVWYCAEHRQIGQDRLSPPVAGPEPVGKPTDQGSLF